MGSTGTPMKMLSSLGAVHQLAHLASFQVILGSSLLHAFFQKQMVYTRCAQNLLELALAKIYPRPNSKFHAPKEVESLPQSVDIIANKNSDQGIVKRTLQAMYGPLICTNWGDPYSPWGSQFKPGTHTQRYKIEIPSDYPSDIVRVELFDPDSINNDVITTTVQRTNVAYKCRFRIFEPNGLSIPKPKSLLFYSNW